VTPELGLLVLAAIFAVGAVLAAVSLIALLPGLLLAESRLAGLRARGARGAEQARDEAGEA